MTRDDERLATASRALRHHLDRAQDEVVGHGRSRHNPRLIEDGRAGELRLNDIRAHFARLGAAVRVTPWYEGALLDRLVDADHADVIEAAVLGVRALGWPRVDTEVSFNQWGDRGSIDFLGSYDEKRAVLIGEAKSAWGSLEETLRRLDVKVRLAPRICADTFGWAPRSIGVVLALPETGATRLVAQRYEATLLAALPERNRDIRRWLRAPSGPLRGLWFLPIGRQRIQPKP